MKNKNALLVLLAVFSFFVITSCSDPNGGKTPQNNGGNSQGQNNPPTEQPPAGNGTLTFRVDLESPSTVLQLWGDLRYKTDITKYQITENVIQLCEGFWEIPLILDYSCGNESFQITNLVNRPEDDDVTIVFNGIEYKCREIFGIHTDDNISIPWYMNNIRITNDSTSTIAEIKFKYRGVESNEIVFLFNQDLGNSEPEGGVPGSAPGLLPDITGTWTADRAGLVGKLVFNSNGTGTAYSGNSSQTSVFNWRTYKDGLNNICEISGWSWYSETIKCNYSIIGNSLTTSHKLGTQGFTFTKQ